MLTTVGITEWLTPGRDHLRPRPGGLGELLLGPLSIWDGAWYLRIAADGYSERQAAAFFPLYPLAIRYLSELTGLSHAFTGVVISNLALLGALMLLRRLVSARYGADVADRTVWLLALAPFGFYFSAVYTESLFLLLSVAALLLAREGRWTAAALALMLVALTRSAGVFVVVPMLFALIEQRGFVLRRLLKPGVQLAAGAAAPLVFAAYLDRRWGDPLLMSSIQTEWTRSFSWPWMTLLNGLEEVRMHFIVPRAACTGLIRDGQYGACLDRIGWQWDTLSDDFGLIATFGAILLLIVTARRLDPGESLYAALLIIFPLFNPMSLGMLISMPRYVTVVWPLFAALALLLERRRLYLATLTVSAALMVLLLALHASAYFVS